jgi:hypothetical protein
MTEWSVSIARYEEDDLYPLVSRYRRVLEPVIRGRLGIVFAVVVLFSAARIGGKPGVMLAAAWMLVSGTYCLANFWCCRESHCVVTGSGWTALGLFGLVAGVAPGSALAWCRVDVLAAAYLVVLAAGYAFEGLAAARTGRHAVGVGRDGAQAR